ncbi:MAG: hypothetical protein JW821_18665 [Deltaproteobacteria bacterium]|nr:hypothetical protein [Deltaproteobacteria bacterium]
MDNIRVTIGIEAPVRPVRRSKKSGGHEVTVSHMGRSSTGMYAGSPGDEVADRYWTRYYSYRYRAVIQPSWDTIFVFGLGSRRRLIDRV